MMLHGFTFRWKCWLGLFGFKNITCNNTQTREQQDGLPKVPCQYVIFTNDQLQRILAFMSSLRPRCPHIQSFLSSCCPQTNIYMTKLPQPISMCDIIKGRRANRFMITLKWTWASQISILHALLTTAVISQSAYREKSCSDWPTYKMDFMFHSKLKWAETCLQRAEFTALTMWH